MIFKTSIPPPPAPPALVVARELLNSPGTVEIVVDGSQVAKFAGNTFVVHKAVLDRFGLIFTATDNIGRERVL